MMLLRMLRGKGWALRGHRDDATLDAMRKGMGIERTS